jgi:DNA-binding response OmpR family regulator
MTSSVTILLVDEEPILRRATALMLTDRGGEVSAVATLGEAVALTERRIFDVAVIDVPARGPSPEQILEQFREHGVLPRRVVVCACSPLERGDAEPTAAVISKPYMFEHLLAAVFGPRRRRRRAARAADVSGVASASGVFATARAGGSSRPDWTQRTGAASALGPIPRRLAHAPSPNEDTVEEASLALDFASSGRASRLRGRRRSAGAARAQARDCRRALSMTFRGSRRAARARRGRE